MFLSFENRQNKPLRKPTGVKMFKTLGDQKPIEFPPSTGSTTPVT